MDTVRTPGRLPWRMRTLAIVASTLIVLVAIVYVASHLILLRNYAQLEEKDTREDVARVRDALLDDISELDRQLNDWAAWDETYTFVRTRDPRYVERNIPDETFVNLRLNAMIVADHQGKIVFARGYDFQARQRAPAPEELLATLQAAGPLMARGTQRGGVAGLLLINRTPMLVAGRPILTSDQTGPSRGVMIMARYLGRNEIMRLSEITHLNVDTFVLDGRTLPDDVADAAELAGPDRSAAIIPLDHSTIAGYTALRDLAGRPLVLLRVLGPRSIYAQGKASVRYFSIWLIAISGLMGLVVASLFDSLVISRVLRRESEAQLRAIVEEASPVAIFSVSPDGMVQTWNPASARIFGWPKEEVIGRPLPLVPPDRQQEFRAILGRALSGEPLANLETSFRRKNGTLIDVSMSTAPLRANGGLVTGVMAVAADITDRKRDETRIQRQLQRLNALRMIDMAITGSLDLRITLSILLEQVMTMLGIDAADVLLLDQGSQRLIHAAGRGFRTSTLQHTRLRLGDGHAGQAALERRVVHIVDLAAAPGHLSRAPLLAQEGFRTYHAVPLIAKGVVKGVLEVFHRDTLTPDAEWTDSLEALAGQAAIAIDNAGLFADLQRANTELVLSYDTALEGWSKALDLRDRETEGHTRRVTELTIVLARAMGIPDSDLVHLRRGALLHDIGKMGIPDSILLKPGPLTNEEWEIMRKHPVHAYELLSQIPHLRPALDIPYAHHEKWDGTGYPRGLEGEHIPLAARIFAAVDVWDALTSDRPYRKAWPEEKARAYIREQAGKHFDPRVVEAFLALELDAPGDDNPEPSPHRSATG